MSENDAYALWIIPDETAYTLTKGYIASLSRIFQLPRFEPHVTVLGGVHFPELAEMRKLAGGLAPFPVRLTREVEYMDEFFRCLFLRAYKTEGLMDAFSKTSKFLGRESKSYFPHLSLAYGDLPVWKKQEMIAELGPIPQIEFEARTISLVHAAKEMPVESWKTVESFPLGIDQK